MKTDRELLELAAKAAGYKDWVDFSPVVGEPALSIRANGGPGMWTPLTDDGDALRLAAYLDLDIMLFPAFGEVQVTPQKGNIEICESTIDDKMSAIRRAIVRAAAAIGDVME